MWFGCLYVFMMFLVWRSEARFREVVLWIFGARELCVSGSVVGRCVVPRVGAWCWLSVGLVGMGVLLWYSFGCCACVLTVWFVYAVLCVLRNSVVGFVVTVVNELHREVRGSKAIGRLSCGSVQVSSILGALGVDLSRRVVGSEFCVAKYRGTLGVCAYCFLIFKVREIFWVNGAGSRDGGLGGFGVG